MDGLARYRGSVLGLACGDALGTTLEFKAPGSFTPIQDIQGGGPFGLRAGEWTDDTSMALCLAASLVECRGFDPLDQLRRYLRWFREGYYSCTGHCFDIGTTVRAALQRFVASGETQPWCGSSDPRSAGNGSLMRLAPVALFYAQRPEEALRYAADSSRTTHGAAEAVDACRYYAGLIIGALQGVPKARLLEAGFSPLADAWQHEPLAPAVAAVAAGSFHTRQPPQIRGSGYVVQALEAALWAFAHSQDFAAGARLAVNLGDDADTTGAIYGQLAGAYYGEAGIPQAWRARLSHPEWLDELAGALWQQRLSA